MRFIILALFTLVPFLFNLTACAATVPPQTLQSASKTSQASAELADARLQAIVARDWQNRMRNNPRAPSGKGPLWPDVSKAHEHKVAARKRATLKALHEIDPARLSPSNQLTWRLLEYQLQDAIAGAAYDAAAQGLITQLWGPQLMSTRIKQMNFSSLEDYQHWLKRLQAFDDYMDRFIERLQQAVNHGITQPEAVMQRVPGEIAANLVDDPTASAFYAPFEHMPDTIPAAKQTELRAAAKKAVAQGVLPAYRRLLDFFNNIYLPNARDKIGVSSLPGGREYYRYLVRHYTTTDMTPEQVHELGLKLVAQIHARMKNVFDEIGFQGSYQDFLHYLRTDPKFYYTDPDRLLEAYRAATKRVDPNLTKVLGTWLLPRVPYGVRPIPAALAPNTYPAYSVPPSRDGRVAGYVGVNLYKPETRPKYAIQVLMCHEGRPGHQLQIPVANQLKNLPKFRRFAYYNAFGEGWALYAETLCDTLGLYDNPYEEFGYLNYQMWRAVRLVVDTGIHYHGWSRERAVSYMQENTALANQNIQTEVDRYIIWPGQALSYMIGERTILSLRKEAKAKLGDQYSLRAFDNVVIGQGSLPMAVLKDVVHRWIERTLSGMPADQLPYAGEPRSLGGTMNSPSTGDNCSNETVMQSANGDANSRRRSAFAVDGAVLSNPTTLQVSYSAGYEPCVGKLGRVEVEQTSSTVTITLHRIRPPESEQPQMCPHYRVLKWVEVRLAKPLGDRKIIDGSSGREVAPGKGGPSAFEP
ncbi:MAG: DUF885 domain-containing protein [Gammaproteobacteria bacterium]|nr:DUF885 domain-containing protein [Gammaproteobacteria bacterium]